MNKKTVILVAGPTAVGKTGIAIRLAEHFRTSIISADSRQCYRELNIGVARPSPEELSRVPHYFIASHSVQEEVNAALFEKLALEWSTEIFKQHDRLVLVGGTGLYLKAFCEGLDDIPPVDEQVRGTIRDGYAQFGLSWLQEEVKAADAEFYASGEIQNPVRLMRALEVVRSSGRSIVSFRSGKKKERPFRIIKLGLHCEREILYRQIDERVRQMFRDGLELEARSLSDFSSLPALQTVGYQEFFQFPVGGISLEETERLISRNTKQYAKRQLTWFRKDAEITWAKPGDWELIKKITEA